MFQKFSKRRKETVHSTNLRSTQEEFVVLTAIRNT